MTFSHFWQDSANRSAVGRTGPAPLRGETAEPAPRAAARTARTAQAAR